MEPVTYAQEPEPEDGDYLLYPSGNLGSHTTLSQYGKILATFRPGESPDSYIRSHMARERFYPSIWYISDHFNPIPYTLED